LDAAGASIAVQARPLAGRARPGALTGRRRPPQAADRHRGCAPRAGRRDGIDRLDAATA
jgi:hypothetical protein